MKIFRINKIILISFTIFIIIITNIYSSNTHILETNNDQQTLKNQNHFEKIDISPIQQSHKLASTKSVDISPIVVNKNTQQKNIIVNVLEEDKYNYETIVETHVSQNNINIVIRDEFFDQIDQKTLNENGKAAGYLIQDLNPINTPVTYENEYAKITDVTDSEINQQAIIENAKLMGYVLEDIIFESESPTEKNSSLPATDDLFEQINY